MKNLVIKISTWAFLAGLLFTGFGLWDIYEEKDVSTEAIQIKSESIDGSNGSLVYVEISGGRLDVTNTYELSLSTKKSDAKLTSNFYTPVLNGGSVAYILKSPLAPTLQEISSTANYSGLLQSKSELPEKILASYNKSFPTDNFSYLDSTYEPKTTIEKIFDLKIFIYLLLGGLAVRFILSYNRKSIAEDDSEETKNT